MSRLPADRTHTLRCRYPLKRAVIDHGEVYDFGRWFPTMAGYEAFLHDVERAHRRLEDASRVPSAELSKAGPLAGWTGGPS
jgi:hypothetical protein